MYEGALFIVAMALGYGLSAEIILLISAGLILLSIGYPATFVTTGMVAAIILGLLAGIAIRHSKMKL
jgi:hypothetical protein